jgi:hypothetical protein
MVKLTSYGVRGVWLAATFITAITSIIKFTIVFFFDWERIEIEIRKEEKLREMKDI